MIKAKSYRVQNFRTIKECTLDFSKGAVGLIGENGVGKTNIARALQFFLTTVRGPKAFYHERENTVTFLPSQPINPGLIFPVPELKARTEHDLELVVSNVFLTARRVPIPDGQQRDEHIIGISLRGEVTVDAVGNPKFDCQIVYRIDKQSIRQNNIGDFDQVLSLLHFEQCPSLRPFTEVEHVLKTLRNKGTTGLNEFRRLNKSVTELCRNFAQLEEIGNKLVGHEAEIPDLDQNAMSSANLQVVRLLSSVGPSRTPSPILIHVEEPELSLHPSLQRRIVKELLERSRKQGIALTIETHSHFILSELLSNGIPCYRVHVTEVDRDSNTRKSSVSALSKSQQIIETLQQMGVDAARAAIGGVIILTDGPTDAPVYQQFLGMFDELSIVPYCFAPIGALAARDIDLSVFKDLAEKVIVIADGHFKVNAVVRDRLKEKCNTAGIVYVELDRWGVENFFPEEALRKAAAVEGRIKLGSAITLEPMKALNENAGIVEISKDFNPLVASFVTHDHLVKQADFMRLVAALKETPRS